MGFLDNTGVARLWEHIMTKFNELVGSKPVAEQIEEAISAIDIPTPTPADVDKFLRVNSAGKYELDAVPNAEEATFGV